MFWRAETRKAVSPEQMEISRLRAELARVKMERDILGKATALKIDQLGDSESILRNKRYLRETAQRLVRRGIAPEEDGWSGWLGRYQKALCEAAVTLDGQHRPDGRKRTRSRDQGR